MRCPSLPINNHALAQPLLPLYSTGHQMLSASCAPRPRPHSALVHNLNFFSLINTMVRPNDIWSMRIGIPTEMEITGRSDFGLDRPP